MGVLEIENYLVQQVLLNSVLLFFTPLEIAKHTNQHHINVRKFLKQMEEQRVIVRHKFKCAYRLDRDYYNNNYIVKPQLTT